MQISVVVPVHNEAENVENLMAEIHQALSGIDAYEMIFVDDGSTDDTITRLREAMRTYSMLRVVQLQRSCGQSRAIHSGVLAAGYAWVATLDGDGQNNPADILALMTVLRQQADDKLWMLTGHRFHRQDTGWRRFSSVFANRVRRAVLHDDTPDTGCGLKLFRRDKFLVLPYFDHMHRFLPALMRMAGGNVMSVKVSHRSRQFGQSKYGTMDRLLAGIVDLLGVVWLKKRHSLPVVSEVFRD
jgi:dolichol-phosphate mannosyltransferase